MKVVRTDYLYELFRQMAALRRWHRTALATQLDPLARAALMRILATASEGDDAAYYLSETCHVFARQEVTSPRSRSREGIVAKLFRRAPPLIELPPDVLAVRAWMMIAAVDLGSAAEQMPEPLYQRAQGEFLALRAGMMWDAMYDEFLHAPGPLDALTAWFFVAIEALSLDVAIPIGGLEASTISRMHDLIKEIAEDVENTTSVADGLLTRVWINAEPDAFIARILAYADTIGKIRLSCAGVEALGKHFAAGLDRADDSTVELLGSVEYVRRRHLATWLSGHAIDHRSIVPAGSGRR